MTSRRIWIAFTLLGLLVFAVYGNTLKASWQLDDQPNIIMCENAHVTQLNIQSLWESVHYKGKINRPIARLSLALNYYAGGLNVTGYHLVNISIHLITSIFLFLTILLIFQTPNLANRYAGSEYFIALLAAVFWAINPVQIQAVTYIVQRMASMAAMFTIISIFFYLKARLTPGRQKKIYLLMGCAVAFLLGLGSKENAAMLPISFLLIELVFFQNFESLKAKKKILITTTIALLVVFFAGFVFLKFNRGDLFWFLDYGRRYFSLPERILTEPRIIIFYLSLLFYPVPTRLSLEHIPQLSTSLFTPWTTIAAILLILFLIGIAFYYLRKLPLLSFAILFFFLNHLIESTILPLELVFEHRNYLPSLFLFLPVAVGLKWLLDKYQDKNHFMYYFLAGFVVLLIIGLGTGTYIRNMAWKTEKMLMEDTIKKAPRSGRAYHNLAYGYYEKIGNYSKAIELYKKSNTLPHHSRDAAPSSLFNLGSIYFDKKKFQKTAEFWERALKTYSDHEKIRYRLAQLYAKQLKDFRKSESVLQPLLTNHPNNPKALNLKGYILLAQGNYEKSLGYFKKCFREQAASKGLLANTGKAHALLSNYSMAEVFFKQAYSKAPRDMNLVLWLIYTALEKQDNSDLERFVKLMIEKADMVKIQSGLKTLKERGLMPEEGQKKIKNLLAGRFQKQANLVFQQD